MKKSKILIIILAIQLVSSCSESEKRPSTDQVKNDTNYPLINDGNITWGEQFYTTILNADSSSKSLKTCSDGKFLNFILDTAFSNTITLFKLPIYDADGKTILTKKEIAT